MLNGMGYTHHAPSAVDKLEPSLVHQHTDVIASLFRLLLPPGDQE